MSEQRPQQPSDAWLLAAARTDPEAFCEVYERHYAPIRSWFLARVRNDAIALDLTAETFAQALRGLYRFRDHIDSRDDTGRKARWLSGERDRRRRPNSARDEHGRKRVTYSQGLERGSQHSSHGGTVRAGDQPRSWRASVSARSGTTATPTAIVAKAPR
jgi:hypothetical protein